MPVDHDPTVRRRQLGNELHRLREGGGLTCDEAAAYLHCHGSKISRIENGRSGIRQRDLRELLDLYGVTHERERAALLGLARDSKKKGWWHTYGDVISDRYADFISLENDARSVREYETQLVPGLLQTEDYARAVMRMKPGRDPIDEVEPLVAVRMARQSRLTGDDPLQLWAIVAEGALRQRVGGPDVMGKQLHHLLDLAEIPNVDLQVLPFTAGEHPGVDGAFTILRFPASTDRDVVAMENLTSALYLEKEEEIAVYELTFDRLMAAALSVRGSTELVSRIAKEM